jgi:hypothetical protein
MNQKLFDTLTQRNDWRNSQGLIYREAGSVMRKTILDRQGYALILGQGAKLHIIEEQNESCLLSSGGDIDDSLILFAFQKLCSFEKETSYNSLKSVDLKNSLKKMKK